MRHRNLAPAVLLLLAAAAAGCDNPLNVTPASAIPDESAITDAASSRAALAGAYHGLQSLSLYGEELVEFGDLSADNSFSSGTFTSYDQADENRLLADNASVTDIWEGSYDDINRANEIIARVPGITDPEFGEGEQNEIIGEAYFLRALNYHNLVKLFGGVPLQLAPISGNAEANDDALNVTRASVADVYTQILSDLDAAQNLITNTEPTTQANVGAVRALRARVLLYKGDYAGAESEALAVEQMGYQLASNYADLFSPNGNSTPEDIFRVIFSQTQENFLSFDYFPRSALGGVYEVAPETSLIQAYDPSYDPDADDPVYAPTDLRGQWNIKFDEGDPYGAKYRSVVGTEFVPVIRFAEVVLIRAEALARLNQLGDATTEVDRIRTRAGLPGVGTLSQDDLIAAIIDERRRELAFEGDRWPDLVRLGLATSVLGIDAKDALYPIPQREIDAAPGLTQNPGY